jgi:hypothetical protein
MILSDEGHRQVSLLLDELRSNSGSRSIFLSDIEGHVLACSGNPGDLNVTTLIALLGGSIATLLAAGKTFDGSEEAIHLIYRESQGQHLYAINVDQRSLLVLVNDRGEFQQRIGTIWYYARQAALNLRAICERHFHPHPAEVISPGLDQGIRLELDQLFGSDDQGFWQEDQA